MKAITEHIDDRIVELEKIRKQIIDNKETSPVSIAVANQSWARIQELKSLKTKYTDKDGNWVL